VRSPSEPEPSPAATEAVVAPPLIGRIHYLIGGTLPRANLEWVRADLTGPGWRHRQARRPLLLMLPFAVAFAILPGPASVRVSIPLGLIVIALVMGYATSESFRNRRLDVYGIPRPKAVEEDDWDDTPATPSTYPSDDHGRRPADALDEDDE
jgi:hypothetical protein